MPETGYLALFLDGPLQSWGFSSRFQRRTTGLHPTKSGVIGLICAALGIAKGTDEERDVLPKLAGLRMSSIVIQREVQRPAGPLPILRLEDYHTVLDTRRASGAMNTDAVVTRRQYLLDARFGVILEGDPELLKRVAAAMEDPTWGVWLGRKSCIPAAPIYRGVFATETEAQRALIGDTPLDSFTTVTEAKAFDEGTDSLSDQPVSFGDGKSSGSDSRRFVIRRIRLTPASMATEDRKPGSS